MSTTQTPTSSAVASPPAVWDATFLMRAALPVALVGFVVYLGGVHWHSHGVRVAGLAAAAPLALMAIGLAIAVIFHVVAEVASSLFTDRELALSLSVPDDTEISPDVIAGVVRKVLALRGADPAVIDRELRQTVDRLQAMGVGVTIKTSSVTRSGSIVVSDLNAGLRGEQWVAACQEALRTVGCVVSKGCDTITVSLSDALKSKKKAVRFLAAVKSLLADMAVDANTAVQFFCEIPNELIELLEQVGFTLAPPSPDDVQSYGTAATLQPAS